MLFLDARTEWIEGGSLYLPSTCSFANQSVVVPLQVEKANCIGAALDS